MGFSVQLALLRGRPSEATLDRWAGTALARLEIVRHPVLAAAGREDEDAAPFTTVFLSRQSVGVEVPQVEAPQGRVHDLPALPAGASDEDVDPFLLTIALLAHAEGVEAAFLVDSSISDCGALFACGKPFVRWDPDSDSGDQDEGRQRADVLLRSVFGDGAPELEELTWLGPGPTFWRRRLPVAARPSIGGHFRRVKKPG
ncbi:MAG: hypothetical protein Q8L48_02675 [Archangium sp.]|nr:hypothetical protein [Archangium sp.]